MFRIITVSMVGAALVAAIACSSPTRPSAVAARVPANPFSALAPGGATCDAYDGQAQGLCHALFAQDCVSAGETSASCDRLIANFRDATGTFPPFVGRFYVSRDVNECLVIRFLCADGFVEFSDSSGCGCQRVL